MKIAARRIHILKTRAPYWADVTSGRKTFEVRRNDRGFQLGDILHLAETELRCVVPLQPSVRSWHPTGRVAEFTISYVLTGGQFGIEPGYVVLGLA